MNYVDGLVIFYSSSSSSAAAVAAKSGNSRAGIYNRRLKVKGLGRAGITLLQLSEG